MDERMPRNVAQWTGLFVTVIVALGCDRDVFFALPIGALAGAIAGGLVALDEYRLSRRLNTLRSACSTELHHSGDAAKTFSG